MPRTAKFASKLRMMPECTKAFCDVRRIGLRAVQGPAHVGNYETITNDAMLKTSEHSYPRKTVAYVADSL